MPKVNEAKGGKVKRLQAGAKDMKKKDELRRKTGTVLTKIVLRIQDLLPEIQMEKAVKRWSIVKSRMMASVWHGSVWVWASSSMIVCVQTKIEAH